MADLPKHSVDQMWTIFRLYYEIEERAEFVRSLQERNLAFIIEDRVSSQIVGFTSVLITNVGKYQVIYSGDTMLEPDYWGAGKHFGYHMTKLITKLYLSRPRRPLYWFLMSQGHRTYLTMARNLVEFYPTWRAPTPQWARSVIEEVAQHRYGNAYQPDTGLIRFPYRRKPLRSWVAPIKEKDLHDPDIAFFVKSNPRWDDGDELACLGVANLRLLLHLWLKFTKVLTLGRLDRLVSRESGTRTDSGGS